MKTFARTLAVALALAAVTASAQEFRTLVPIRAPSAPLPDGARRVQPPVEIPRRVIEDAINQVAASWNTPALARYLSANFYDRTRLTDNVNATAPRDARLRVLGVQAIQLLEQYRTQAGQPYPLPALVSRLSVTVRTQVEFNDASGFRRLPGTNEFLLTLPQPEAGEGP